MPEMELQGRDCSASVTKALPSHDSRALDLLRWSSPTPYVPLAQSVTHFAFPSVRGRQGVGRGKSIQKLLAGIEVKKKTEVV